MITLILAILGPGGFNEAAAFEHASPESQLLAPPILPEAFVHQNPLPVLPSLSDTAGTAVDRASEAVVPLRTPAAVDRQATLIAARVLEKYRPFRDSLRSP